MEKKDKKSGKRGRGLDTIGKRILVLTIAILMTFQFCTPTFYGISFADEQSYLEETEQPVDEQVVDPAETPEEEVQAEEPQGEAADPVLDETVAEEPVDEVPADTVNEQEEPADADVDELVSDDATETPANTGEPSKAPAVNPAKASNDAKGDGEGGVLRADGDSVTYTVQFYDRYGETMVATETGTEGETITLPSLNLVEQREDYTVSWALASYENDGQSYKWKTSANKSLGNATTYTIDVADLDPNQQVIGIMPWYEKKTYTITFYAEDPSM